jgi:uncharacterized protein YutE (UPF0331/DUF86 family)
MINGVITGKLQSLDETLNELSSVGEVSSAQLNSDWRTRRAIERDLQILVEIVVDVCQRIISLAGQTPPESGVDAIERCIQLGVLSDNEAYRKMVRFRNLIVHRYEYIDVAILVDIANNRLDDLRSFRDEVLRYAVNRP